jgi:hypothetical protein
MNQSSVKGNNRDEMVKIQDLPLKIQAVGVAASLVPASAQTLGAY